MRRMWKKFVNLVRRYVPGLRKSKGNQEWGFYRTQDEVIVKGPIEIGTRSSAIIADQLVFQQVQPKKRSEGSAEGWPTPFEIYTYLQKEWKEQEDEGLLPKYVFGVDPYESGEQSRYSSSLGGEHRPHIPKRDPSVLGGESIKYPSSHVARTHPVRRITDEPQVPGVGKRDAELDGDSAKAFGLALQERRRKYKADEGPKKIPVCDQCGEIIDDKPKEGWLGFATTKTGYLYCGRCYNKTIRTD